MDTIFPSFAKKGGKQKKFSTFYRNENLFVPPPKKSPINPIVNELGPEERGSNYGNGREFSFRRQKASEKKKSRIKSHL
jgi:hypothetical protein